MKERIPYFTKHHDVGMGQTDITIECGPYDGDQTVTDILIEYPDGGLLLPHITVTEKSIKISVKGTFERDHLNFWAKTISDVLGPLALYNYSDGSPEIRILKKLIGIRRVAEHLGIELHEEGNRLVGDCPFCKVKGQFAINENAGVFNCFACESSGDMIDLAGNMMDDASYDDTILKVLNMAAKDAESKS